MPNLFARQTALTNVGGRIDYISNPRRQENLLAFHDGAADLVSGAYWRQLAEECQLASKHVNPGHKSVQGRELIIQLSNSLLQRLTPEEIAKTLGDSFTERFNRPCAVAIHFNKNRTNLHAHLIYAERELLQQPKEKVATRALFFDEAGKRHYKKAEILSEDGQLRPGCKIVAKGEIYERRHFGAVDQTFSQKGWLREAKSQWLLPLRNGALHGDVEITEYDPGTGKLPQQHVGNEVQNGVNLQDPEIARRIERYNASVKDYNQMIDDGMVPEGAAAIIQRDIAQRAEKEEILQHLNIYLRYKWSQDLAEQRAAEENRKLDMKARLALAEMKRQLADKQLQIFKSDMDWKLQAQLDEIMGTDFAKQDKARFFEQRNKDHER